jgi:type III restriction enzyme
MSLPLTSAATITGAATARITATTRPSQVVYNLTKHLVMNRYRDPDGSPRLHLFGQLKRIARDWLDHYLVCEGNTFPAQLHYKTLADRAADRIIAAINSQALGKGNVIAELDPYNPVGSTAHVNFTTTKATRWEPDTRRCHLNWLIVDSDWEAEFCRVVEQHPRVSAYVKNHNLGFEVPYRHGGELRMYRPDFIVQIDDGYGEADPLNLVVEIKGYRREDAKGSGQNRLVFVRVVE